MKTTFFKELARKEQGTFYFQDKDISLGMGVRSPHVVYRVEFVYKKHEFIVENITGTAFVATITCRFATTLRPIEFSVQPISHLKNLFLRKNNRLTVNTENQNLQFFIENNSSFKKLNGIACEHNFSPAIDCDADPVSQIVTKYHLEFDDWTDPVEVLIQLYKDLIDEFEKAHLNISPAFYKRLNR
jgi:hypothetical protein